VAASFVKGLVKGSIERLAKVKREAALSFLAAIDQPQGGSKITVHKHTAVLGCGLDFLWPAAVGDALPNDQSTMTKPMTKLSAGHPTTTELSWRRLPVACSGMLPAGGKKACVNSLKFDLNSRKFGLNEAQTTRQLDDRRYNDPETRTSMRGDPKAKCWRDKNFRFKADDRERHVLRAKASLRCV